MDKSNKTKKEKKGSPIITISIIVLVIGIVIAISIPGYLKPSPRSRQSEAKSNLGAIFTAQVVYSIDTGIYASHNDMMKCFKLIGWEPPENSHFKSIYSYFCDTDKIESKKHPGECPAPPVIPISKNGFTAIAVGNIDRDATCDVWYVNDAKDLWNMKMLKDGTIVEGSDLDDKSLLDRFSF